MRRTLIALAILVAGVTLIAGCATTDGTAIKRSLYVDDHPEISELMADAILNGQIMVGMTSDMVQVAWGKPVRVEPVQEDEIDTRWVYGNYFVGGNITSLYFDPGGTLVRYEVNYQQTHANNGTVSAGGTEDTRGTLSGSEVLLSKESGSRP
jgi:outer membrane protein assembly factor BamE (lipoprotein component of BamABCDE complex)